MGRWIFEWMSRWADDRTGLKDKNMEGWVNRLMLDMRVYVYGRVVSMSGLFNIWVLLGLGMTKSLRLLP